jgi:hypothetical protein
MRMTHTQHSCQIFTEIGYGNRHIISTEIEKGTQEKRISGFVRMHITSVYLRIWIGYKVYILSSHDGFKITLKNRRAFKFLFGIAGHRCDKKQ